MNRVVKLRCLAFTLSLFALTGIFAQPVLGVKPDVETFTDQYTVSLPCPDGCSSLIVDIKEDVRITTFFDSDGNPIRMHVRIHGRETITHSETGNSISDNWAFTRIFDFEEGTWGPVGLVFKFVIPGEGPNTIYFVKAGKVVFDMETGEVIFQSANAYEWPLPDFVAYFCSYLGQA